MKDLPLDKLRTVTQAFYCITLLSEHLASAIYDRDDVPTAASDEIANDLAIIVDRLRAAQAAIDKTYPGFSALVEQEEKMAEARLRRRSKDAS